MQEEIKSSRVLKWVAIIVCAMMLVAMLPAMAVSAAPKEITLEEGDEGKAVTLLQERLEKLGFFPVKATGFYGAMTVSSVKSFQKYNELAIDGVAGPKTLKKVFGTGYTKFLESVGGSASSSSTSNTSSGTSSEWIAARKKYPNALMMGDSGDKVTKLQKRLKELGYYTYGSITGYFGPVTLTAVKNFQKSNGSTVDGIVGDVTSGKIYSSKAVKASKSTASSKTPSKGSAMQSTAGSTKADKVIAYARQFLGNPYVYGTAGPRTFDCSGLTQYSYKYMGYSLRRSANDQAQDGRYTKVSRSELKKGDLIFFNKSGSGTHASHVGMYIGGGTFIHAANSKIGIVESSMDTSYYTPRFMWGRRVFS